MAIFKNYLQRLIEANTAADAEQSGGSVAPTTTGFVGQFATEMSGFAIEPVVYDNVLLTGADLSYAEGLLAVEEAGTYAVMGYATWLFSETEIGTRHLTVQSIDADPGANTAAFPFALGLTSQVTAPGSTSNLSCIVPIVGYLPAGAHVQIALGSSDQTLATSVSVYLTASRIL